ncbi:anthranilate phosphoribosyltransferase [Kappamyces sp. JEL0829]|nr:anthranilate phosphoribosyltransferase [Kappamyces sp. JEL0829]
MAGKLSPSQIGAFLTSLKLLGLETNPHYITAVAKAMRDAALPIAFPANLTIVDIVGTGGDGQDTFNVSTASSIVAAGAGCKVAKHGNRASSSSCGSADVLEALNCRLDKATPAVVQELFENGGDFCFLFAQLYHPANKSVAGPRKELGVRTIFNILGPLTNPARPNRMVVGVFSKDLGSIMAQSLSLLGVERAWVVCGEMGLDEISPQGKTHVWELQPDKSIKELVISPSDFGLPEHPLAAVKGGDAKYNSATMRALLSGELTGPVLDFVLLNSAALLFVAGKASSLVAAVDLARISISSGKAKEALERFSKTTLS